MTWRGLNYRESLLWRKRVEERYYFHHWTLKYAWLGTLEIIWVLNVDSMRWSLHCAGYYLSIKAWMSYVVWKYVHTMHIIVVWRSMIFFFITMCHLDSSQSQYTNTIIVDFEEHGHVKPKWRKIHIWSIYGSRFLLKHIAMKNLSKWTLIFKTKWWSSVGIAQVRPLFDSW